MLSHLPGPEARQFTLSQSLSNVPDFILVGAVPGLQVTPCSAPARRPGSMISGLGQNRALWLRTRGLEPQLTVFPLCQLPSLIEWGTGLCHRARQSP